MLSKIGNNNFFVEQAPKLHTFLNIRGEVIKVHLGKFSVVYCSIKIISRKRFYQSVSLCSARFGK